MNAISEQVISNVPLVVRRRVKWGECDPAGVVYTVTFSEYVMSVADLFYGALFDTTPQRAKLVQGFGTPSRALSFDFRRALWPDDEFDMTVTVADVKSRTYVLDVTACTLQRDVVFVAKLTPICLADEERRSIEIPAAFRHALLSYRAACVDAITTKQETCSS